MSSNITVAAFGAKRHSVTKTLYQYDYGQILKIEGVTLPSAYEVHFSNTPEAGESKTSIGNADGVVIPDEYLESGADIYAFVYLHTGADDGETVYTVKIPVAKRPEPTDAEPTPAQQGVIEQTIAALNEAVEAFDERADEIEEMIDEYGGIPGEKGEKGDDGFSPLVTMETVSAGVILTIVDAEGSHQTIIAKGEKGDSGKDGTQISTGTAVEIEGQSYPAGENRGDLYLNTTTGDLFRWLGAVWIKAGNIKGAKGDTPVRGIDYWTAADQAAIVADVLAALPTAEGGAY